MRLLWRVALSVGLLAILSGPAQSQDLFRPDGSVSLSDRRYKHDIEALDIAGIETVLKLRPVSFYWNEPSDEGMKGEQIGFIAQEVEKVFPAAVIAGTNAEKTRGIRYDTFIPILVKAIQEQTHVIEVLSARLDTQKAQIEVQEKEITALKRER